ncbi:F0F1 ATP synthase subunit epsilon [bacterium]|nr:MAG: F0F1 ATP synthase subunit epsilon [bacterium]
MYMEIVTPNKIIFKGNVLSATVPGSKSPFQILFNHAPIVSSLDAGQIKFVDENNNEIKYNTGTGFVELDNNRISILIEDAEIVE